MRIRRTGLVAVLTGATLALAGCGGGDSGGSAAGGASPATEGGPAAEASDIRVGLAYDVGGRGDKSFNDAAAAGLDQAKTELGVEIQELSPNAGGTNRGDNLRLLAEQGFNPVIAVGFAYAEELPDVAEQFPETSFAIIDDPTVEAENVTNLLFAEEQGSFLVGAAAALTRPESTSFGYIGGVQTPLLEKFEAGYVAGVQHVRPGAQVAVRYLTQPPDFSGFNAPDRGREAAQGLLDAGASVIYAAAGGSGTGVFQAAVAGDALAIGVDSDQYLTAPPDLQPVILTSMVKRVDVAVLDFITDFSEDDGQVEPGPRTYDLAVEGVGYSTSGGGVDPIVPQLEELEQQIIAGQIKVPTTPQG